MRTLTRADKYRTILELIDRHDRFTYDLRGECRVLSGCVAAYRMDEGASFATDLGKAVSHAFTRDGILGAWRDPATGAVRYSSCRVFTDQDQALRFASEQEQKSVFNLNRMTEVKVADWLNAMTALAVQRAGGAWAQQRT
jgi:hypothetical protein